METSPSILSRGQLAEDCMPYLTLIFQEIRETAHNAAIISPQKAVEVHHKLKALESIEKLINTDIRCCELARKKLNNKEITK